MVREKKYIICKECTGTGYDGRKRCTACNGQGEVLRKKEISNTMIINYKQAQLLIDTATGELKGTLKRLFAIAIVSYNNDIKVDGLYITTIKHYFTLPNQLKVLEEIFNPYVLTTEDGIKKYEGNRIFIVSDIVGTTIRSTVKNNKIYLSLFAIDNKKIAKAFHSEKKADEYVKQLLWKPGELYWVKLLVRQQYALKYASHTIGQFFKGQNKSGSTIMFVQYKIATGVTIPNF